MPSGGARGSRPSRSAAAAKAAIGAARRRANHQASGETATAASTRTSSTRCCQGSMPNALDRGDCQPAAVGCRMPTLNPPSRIGASSREDALRPGPGDAAKATIRGPGWATTMSVGSTPTASASAARNSSRRWPWVTRAGGVTVTSELRSRPSASLSAAKVMGGLYDVIDRENVRRRRRQAEHDHDGSDLRRNKAADDQAQRLQKQRRRREAPPHGVRDTLGMKR